MSDWHTAAKMLKSGGKREIKYEFFAIKIQRFDGSVRNIKENGPVYS